MNHLTVDEIIDFVSLTELNEESIALANAVNKHIRNCEECGQLVDAFQEIYDEFSQLLLQSDFEKYLRMQALEKKEAYPKELRSVLEERYGKR